MELKFTKKVMKEETRKVAKRMLEQATKEQINEIFNIYAKNMEGRLYIHSKATLKQIDSLYEDLINYASDNRLEIE